MVNTVVTKIPINYEGVSNKDKFENYCQILKINMSLDDESFNLKLIKLKEYYIKQFALNIHKKYINDLDSCISKIECNLEKIKDKFQYIDFLSNNMNLKKNCNDIKAEDLEFEDSIFITSDDTDKIDSVKSVKVPIKFNKSTYLNEYSN